VRTVDRPELLPAGQEVAEAAGCHPLGISGAVAWDDGGQTRVLLVGPGCEWPDVDAALATMPDSVPPKSVLVWRRHAEPKRAPIVPGRGTEPGSRTDRALQLLARYPEMTPFEAASRLGIHPSAVYRAIRRSARPSCPCCGRPVTQQAESAAAA
jgi:hypothetical protein